MKVEFKPRDKTKIYMFEHKGEAIVFWLCITGLLILTFFTVFRYYSLNKIRIAYRNLQTSIPILSKVDDLENLNMKLKNQSDSLIKELEDNKNNIARIRTELDSLKTNLDFINVRAYQRGLKPFATDSNRQQQKGSILKTFKIKTVAKKMK